MRSNSRVSSNNRSSSTGPAGSNKPPIINKHDMWIALSKDRYARLYIPSDLSMKESRQLSKVLRVVGKANREAGIEYQEESK